MANITLPPNPTNGDKVTVGQRVYVYDSSNSRWSSRAFQYIGKMPTEITFGTPDLSLSANSLTLLAFSKTYYIDYTVSTDSAVTLTSSGVQDITIDLYTSNNTIAITTDVAAGGFSGGQITVRASNFRVSENLTISLDTDYPPSTIGDSAYGGTYAGLFEDTVNGGNYYLIIDPVSSGAGNHTVAENYISARNTAQYNGYNDWELATYAEMQAMYPYKGVLGLPSRIYWSSTQCGGSTEWYVFAFQDGSSGCWNSSVQNNGYAFAVRRVPEVT